MQLQPLRPDLSGIYHLKYNDQNWAFSLISLQGCYLRIAKIIIDHHNYKEIEANHLTKYFSEKFIQVRICPDSPCLYDTMGKIGGKSTYHAAIVSIVGVLLDSSIVSIKISFQTREEATLWHLALEKAKSFISRQASSGDMQVLIDVSFRMKSAVPIRDRFYYMHVHTRCFLGSDAVRWIQSDQHCSEQEAVELGNRMLNVNLIYHVQHNRFFFNSKYLYRFNKHSLRDIVEGLLAPIGIIPDLTFSNSKRLASSVSPNHKAEEDEYKPIPAQTEDPSIQLELMTLKSTRGSINQLKRSHHKIITELSNLKELHEDQKQTLQTYKFIVVCLLCTFISHIILRDHYYCSFANMLTFYAASFVFFYFLKRFTRIGTADDTNRDEFPDEYSALLATSTVLDEDVPLPTVLDKNMLALPVPSSWPNRPILVRRSPSMFIAEESLLERLEPSERERIFRLTRPLHIHTPDPEMSVVEIDSNVFCGKLYTIFAGLKDSPIKFFRYHRLIPLYNLSRSKKRLFEVIIQGRFKKSVPFCEVYTGQIFSKPFTYLPPSWLTQMILMLLSKLQPALQVSLEGSSPYLLSPLASTAKNIFTIASGQQSWRRTSPVRTNRKLSRRHVPSRWNIFRNEFAAASKISISKIELSEIFLFPGLWSRYISFISHPLSVYTFDFFQHVFNLATMKIDIGVTTLDVLQIIGRAPVQIMSIHWDPMTHPNALTEAGYKETKLEYLYNVEVWHEKAFPQGRDGEPEPLTKKIMS